jgi:hypothetical protein
MLAISPSICARQNASGKWVTLRAVEIEHCSVEMKDKITGESSFSQLGSRSSASS